MSRKLINGCYKGVEFKYREDTEPEIKSFDENYLHKCETCTDCVKVKTKEMEHDRNQKNILDY